MGCLWCRKAIDFAGARGQAKLFCSQSCKNMNGVTNWRRRTKLRAVAYMGGSCQVCGYKRCAAALAFHHKDPKQKDFIISGGSIKSWDRMKKELDRCVLLCSNCHAEEHERLFQSSSTGRASGC